MECYHTSINAGTTTMEVVSTVLSDDAVKSVSEQREGRGEERERRGRGKVKGRNERWTLYWAGGEGVGQDNIEAGRDGWRPGSN